MPGKHWKERVEEREREKEEGERVEEREKEEGEGVRESC